MAKKKYQIVFKFSDVFREIEAEDLEEAQEIANNMKAPLEDTYCYEAEAEEID